MTFSYITEYRFHEVILNVRTEAFKAAMTVSLDIISINQRVDTVDRQQSEWRTYYRINQSIERININVAFSVVNSQMMSLWI